MKACLELVAGVRFVDDSECVLLEELASRLFHRSVQDAIVILKGAIQ